VLSTAVQPFQIIAAATTTKERPVRLDKMTLPARSTPPPPGIYVPAVIFFDENDELDVESIKKHVLRLAEVQYDTPMAQLPYSLVVSFTQGGVTGILVQGSNGEAQFLSHEERKAAIRITKETLDENGFNDTIVIAGTGTQSTKETR